MQSALLAEPQPITRPSGIRVLAVVAVALGAYLLGNAILIFTGAASLASGRYLLGEYATMGPVIYLLTSALLLLLGIGLWKGWRIARRLTIIVGALLLATSILPISAAFAYWQVGGIAIHGLKIILVVLAIQYLVRPDVAQYFSARSAR
jgi:hypothetical protein